MRHESDVWDAHAGIASPRQLLLHLAVNGSLDRGKCGQRTTSRSPACGKPFDLELPQTHGRGTGLKRWLGR
jgi:hypothetical protein